MTAEAVRVLVVEDEARLVAALRRGLQAEGFAVETSPTTGVTGLALARHGDYDAVVLDVMLPGLSGYEVVRALRAEEQLGAGADALGQGRRVRPGRRRSTDGADDYLTKPFSYVVLLARLRALLRRGAPARPAVLTAGDLQPRPGAAARSGSPASRSG